jgi:hypothetical protein
MPVPSKAAGADVAIIDYGMGNLLSVSKAFEHVAPKADIVVTSDPGRHRFGAARGVSRRRRDARLHA